MLSGIVWLEMQRTDCPWSFEVDLDFSARVCVPGVPVAGATLLPGRLSPQLRLISLLLLLEKTLGIHKEIPLFKYLH